MAWKLPRWRRHFIAQVAIISVVLHAIMAAVMLPAPLAAINAFEGMPVGATLICSSQNFEQVTPDGIAGLPQKQRPPTACPICDGIATSGFLLEIPPAAYAGRLADPTILHPSEELPPAGAFSLANNNRGPPFAA